MSLLNDLKRENNIGPNKTCVSCGENGHTYLACDKFVFGEAVAEAFGVPYLFKKREQEGEKK